MLIPYAVLFAWSFAAATVLPLGSEVALGALVRREQVWFWPVVVATIGNALGACTTFWLGRRAAGLVARRHTAGAAEQRAARWLRRWGRPALLLSWVPLVGDALVAAAGASGVPFAGFFWWMLPGKALRYLVVAWAVLQVR